MILSWIMAASDNQLRTARLASRLRGAVAGNVHLRAGTPEGSCRDRHISNAIPDHPQADSGAPPPPLQNPVRYREMAGGRRP